jgi:membrane dipeptidase
MLFDAHGDILTDLYFQAKRGNFESFRTRHLQNYLRGGITHSIFVNWSDPFNPDPSLFNDIFKYAIKEIHKMQDILYIIKNNSDMFLSSNKHKIGVILGIEGLSQLQDLNHLHHLYKMGVRHASLTWNEANRYAGGLSMPHQRLTQLGIQLLQEMENLGMIIDLAHSNEKTFYDILEYTTKPIIVSHGNVKALCKHKRNYSDEQLLALSRRGGVIGICAIPSFVSEDSGKQNVQEMAKHIDYAVRLMGIDHVGVGFDICYYLDDITSKNELTGFNNLSDAQNVFIELEKIGYTKEQIQKIKYDNFARVIAQILE